MSLGSPSLGKITEGHSDTRSGNLPYNPVLCPNHASRQSLAQHLHHLLNLPNLPNYLTM